VSLGREDAGFAIKGMFLNAVVDAEMEEDEIRRLSDEARRTCPVARALAGVLIDHALTVDTQAAPRR